MRVFCPLGHQSFVYVLILISPEVSLTALMYTTRSRPMGATQRRPMGATQRRSMGAT